MSNAGYYRFPTVSGSTLVFVSEDDLWTTSLKGGPARRLTAGLAECSRPQLSPDGAWVAFTGKEEGNPEVYVMPAGGGAIRRLTYLGMKMCQVVGWRGEEVIFASPYGQPFLKLQTLFVVSCHGGEPKSLGLGSAMSISFGANGVVALGRNTLDIARWKRYRGGTAGNLWIDVKGAGQFSQLHPHTAAGPVRGNLASPMLLGERLYFVSDHEGVGNIYSCDFEGANLRRHTDHETYYVRNPSTDGTSVVYHAGGELYRLDVASGLGGPISVEMYSQRVQRSRRFVDASRYLEDFTIHPDGHAVAVVTRGQSFSFPSFERAVTPVGDGRHAFGAVRYRLTEWLAGGRELVTVSDAPGEECLEVYGEGGARLLDRLGELDVGRVVQLTTSPRGRCVALSNHRQEVIFVDLDRRTARVLDQSLHQPIAGIDFSPDGRMVAYGFADSGVTSVLRVAEVESGEVHTITRPVLRDIAPCFDPEGRYLYFLSYRVFNPVYDNLDFDMNFPRGMRPYAISLRKDLPNPFEPSPLPEAARKALARKATDEPSDAQLRPGRVAVDWEGIEDRVVALPVPEDKYEQLLATHDKIFFTSLPVAPDLGTGLADPAPATLHLYDLKTWELTTVARGITRFKLSMGGDTLIYRVGQKLRVVPLSELDDGVIPAKMNDAPAPGRKGGWVDLSRLKVQVEPGAEWRQMYAEAWRLQRDNFWQEDMSGVDWRLVYDRYLPLVDRVSSRAEFSDLMWEMQGELGTSHCYEMGGDYRPEPAWSQGGLGADFEWDATAKVWRILHIVEGDVWDESCDSPLRQLSVNAEVGGQLVAINGRRLTADLGPRQMLMNLGGQSVTLTLADTHGRHERSVVVKTLTNETPLRYREWVERNRRKVHEATGGKVGYVHVPNMMGLGMSEFFRGYLAEVARDALIVDVRFNGGGHTSQLILEKLARRRLGYDISRWGQPQPYPSNAVMGPIVAITNEFAGSDGDIFSHSFKLMNLGTLVGKRTWGGVIGIWPRHALSDGTMTSQPEFSFWFEDVGWHVENYGTDPHIEVDIRPQDYQGGLDPQLDRALAEILSQMAQHVPGIPQFPRRPDLSIPRRPPRNEGN